MAYEPISDLEAYFRDRSLDPEPSAGAFALAYAALRLANSLDALARTFAPPERVGSFESDHFLMRLASRIEALATQLRTTALLVTRLVQQQGTDPPEAGEFRHHRKRPKARAP